MANGDLGDIWLRFGGDLVEIWWRSGGEQDNNKKNNNQQKVVPRSGGDLAEIWRRSGAPLRKPGVIYKKYSRYLAEHLRKPGVIYENNSRIWRRSGGDLAEFRLPWVGGFFCLVSRERHFTFVFMNCAFTELSCKSSLLLLFMCRYC